MTDKEQKVLEELLVFVTNSLIGFLTGLAGHETLRPFQLSDSLSSEIVNVFDYWIKSEFDNDIEVTKVQTDSALWSDYLDENYLINLLEKKGNYMLSVKTDGNKIQMFKIFIIRGKVVRLVVDQFNVLRVHAPEDKREEKKTNVQEKEVEIGNVAKVEDQKHSLILAMGIIEKARREVYTLLKDKSIGKVNLTMPMNDPKKTADYVGFVLELDKGELLMVQSFFTSMTALAKLEESISLVDERILEKAFLGEISLN